MGGDTGAKTCMSGSQIKYDNCKPCPNLGTLSSCPSPFTCTYEECSNRYYKSGCQSGYDWNASAQTCTAQCSSDYKYTCTSGSYVSGGSGTACGGKYKACTCSYPYSWISGACSCSSSYKYTCTGTGYAGGSGAVCSGKYTSCICSSPYTWSSGACSCPSSYKYNCKSGSYVTGGSGTSCGGKYTACSCSSGYFWSGEACVQENICMKGSQLGYILNSDMTVTSTKQSGKTPIGVVVCSYSGGGGQAMALKSIGSYQWGGYGTDIPDLSNYYSETIAYNDTTSCSNTAKIIAAGDKNTYPAAWATYEYTTTGTNTGDWCLPAAGVFTSYFANQSAVNTGFTRAGGTRFTLTTKAWASSGYSSIGAWDSYFDFEYGLGNLSKTYSREVRPVIEF